MVKQRVEVLFLVFLVVVALLLGRLVFLQGMLAPAFVKRAKRMQERKPYLYAHRGKILDRLGAPLAIDVVGKSVAVNPRLVADPEATVARLGTILALDNDTRLGMLTRLVKAKSRNQAYCEMRRAIPRQQALHLELASTREEEALLKSLQLRDWRTRLDGTKLAPVEAQRLAEAKATLRLRGLSFEDRPLRTYTGGNDGIQVLGLVSSEGVGLEGVEAAYNSTLKAVGGRGDVRVNAAGDPIPHTEEPGLQPKDGADVQLTLDRNVQHFVEQELARMAAEQKPEAATAIVMRVKDGDVLGMASWPAPTGREPGELIPHEERRNRAICDLFEPGSVFKVVTAAAALEAGVNTHAYCGGKRAIGKWTVGCAHGARHGAVDLKTMVEVSCNLAAGSLAERVGPRRMYETIDKFGLQTPIGWKFAGERNSRMLPPKDWRTIRTVNIGFGQGIALTPMQLAAAYAAIANGGVYNPPRLVLSAPGSDIKRPRPHRVMSAENAATLRRYMTAVVSGSRGTGKSAKVPGFTVAGKTGTAQMVDNGRYLQGAYVASFAGFLPASRPELVILVSVWHPRKGQYGGSVAAPVFREIARHCSNVLSLRPDEEIRPEPTRLAHSGRRSRSPQ